jgi:hypothetical protein
MPSTISQYSLRQDCLGKLNQLLDLALHSAEAASAEGNHRIVLQAAREAIRIVTLINKLETSGQKIAPKQAPSLLPAQTAPVETLPRQKENSGKIPGKTISLQGINQSYQQNNPCNKIAGKNLQPWNASAPPVPEKTHTTKEKYSPGPSPASIGGIGSLSLHSCAAPVPRPEPTEAPGNRTKTSNSITKPGAWLEAIDAGRLDFYSLNAIGAGRSLPDIDKSWL